MGRNTSINNATRSMSSNVQSNKAKETILKKINKERYEDDYMNGFCWPPRSYTCSFCKREFRSAQALGGHMNVHRKDKARLRQYSPPIDNHYHGQFTSTFLNLNLKPNPNPNPSFLIPSSSSYVSTKEISSPMLATNLSTLCKVVNEDPMLSMKEGSDLAKRNKYEQSSYGVCSIFHGFVERENVCKSGSSEKAEESTSVRLELEIGLLGQSKVDNLDLELRLGYA